MLPFLQRYDPAVYAWNSESEFTNCLKWPSLGANWRVDYWKSFLIFAAGILCKTYHWCYLHWRGISFSDQIDACLKGRHGCHICCGVLYTAFYDRAFNNQHWIRHRSLSKSFITGAGKLLRWYRGVSRSAALSWACSQILPNLSA